MSFTLYTSAGPNRISVCHHEEGARESILREPPTYPVRPHDGGPLPGAPPKAGDWAYEPKYNGWRALVHAPTGAIWNRRGAPLTIQPQFREALAELARSDARWLDVEALERRHDRARGTLVVLNVIGLPISGHSLDFQRDYRERRAWLEPRFERAPLNPAVWNRRVYLTPSFGEVRGQRSEGPAPRTTCAPRSPRWNSGRVCPSGTPGRSFTRAWWPSGRTASIRSSSNPRARPSPSGSKTASYHESRSTGFQPARIEQLMNIAAQIAVEKQRSLKALLDGNDAQCTRSADRLAHLLAVATGRSYHTSHREARRVARYAQCECPSTEVLTVPLTKAGLLAALRRCGSHPDNG